MPAPGDQYRDTKASINPFIEDRQVNPTHYTATEIATLQARLDKQLGPEYISTRPGAGGGKVHYLAAEKVINLANEVFGFNGWSSAIQNVQVDFVDESPTSGKITLGLSIIVRVTLKDGTFHEDIGYGHIENCKGKAAAFEKAKKEAATDALKRALRNFGKVLGNCLYDKEYLAKVTKLKIEPSKWNADKLHRHPDYAPIKKESVAEANQAQDAQAQKPRRMESAHSAVTNGSTEYGEDEFGSLDEVDFSHPDEVMLNESTTDVDTSEATIPRASVTRQQPTRVHSVPELNQARAQRTPQQIQEQRQKAVEIHLARQANNAVKTDGAMLPPPPNGTGIQQPQNRSSNSSGGQAGPISHNMASNWPTNHATPPTIETAAQEDVPLELPPGAPVGFVTGRTAAEGVAKPFDPHYESPSIRRTVGLHSGKSEPMLRSKIGAVIGNAEPATAAPSVGAAAPTNGTAFPRPNFVNPAADTNRRIGMPGGMQSPMGNRGAYKPPAMKRPPPETPSRQPLSDMSNMQQTDGPSEAKKAKTDGQQPDQQNTLPQSS